MGDKMNSIEIISDFFWNALRLVPLSPIHSGNPPFDGFDCSNGKVESICVKVCVSDGGEIGQDTNSNFPTAKLPFFDEGLDAFSSNHNTSSVLTKQSELNAASDGDCTADALEQVSIVPSGDFSPLGENKAVI